MTKDIVAQEMKDNETWNECPICSKTWQTFPSVPGVLYRIVVCSPTCQKRTN